MTAPSTSNAPHQQGIEALRKGQLEVAAAHFQRGADAGDSAALKELGLCLLHGMGLTADVARALECFNRSQDQSESLFELYKLCYFGHGTSQDRAQSLEYLTRAAGQLNPQAILHLALLAVMRGDLDRSRDLANLSQQPDDRIHALLQASPPQWPHFVALPRTELCDAPVIFSVDDVLHPVECWHLMQTARPYLRPSMTVHPQTGAFVRDDMRTSQSASFDWLLEDPVVHQIMQKCALQAGLEAECSEPLQVLHYQPGQEYRPHYDFFGEADDPTRQDKPQRQATLCCYLNDVAAGGDTVFPNAGVRIHPKAGRLIGFHNLDAQGRPQVNSLHAGEPVLTGEKWLATLWMHQQPTQRGMHYESPQSHSSGPG